MAHEITLINGVSKQEINGELIYFFPTCIIKAFTDATPANEYYEMWLNNGQAVQTVQFDDITDKLGQATLTTYLDQCATNGFFFDSSTISAVSASSTFSTDNEVLRSDGAGTRNVQGSTVYVDDSGNLGLGISSPAEKLHVVGVSRFDSPVQFPSYTVATLPSAATAGQQIFVSDETGGAVMAFSDGTNWRRMQDRAIVS